MSDYIGNAGKAFLVFPLLVAVAGAFLVRTQREMRLIVLLALPSAAGFALLYFGGSYLVNSPRLVFFAYPAVYVLCGLVVSRVAHWIAPNSRGVFPALAGTTVALNVILSNADIFGLPWIYYLFFNKSTSGAGF